MRAHPAAQFTLTHFGAWRRAVRFIGAAAASALVAWIMSTGSPVRLMGWPAATAVLLLLLAAWAAVRPGHAPLSLRWEGRSWSLTAIRAGGPALQAGELSVSVDLGVWMLLRFTATDVSVRPRVVWIPAQRAGHALQWHALRCAVYSPRPDAGVDAAPDV